MEPFVEELVKQVGKNNGMPVFTKTVTVGSKETVFKCNQTKVQLKHGNRVLHLLIKTPPEDKETRAIQKTGQKFSNEILFYKEIYSRLKKHGWNGRTPMFFTSSMDKGKEVIVLEDLEKSTYKAVNIAQGLDDDHLKLVMSALSDVHNAVLSWKTKEETDYNNIVTRLKDTTILDVPDEDETTMQKVIISSSLDAGISHSKHHFGKEVGEKVETFKKTVFTDMRGWFDGKDPKNILIHGDYWNDVFMFKYEEKVPVDIAITDWQNIRIGSPFADVSLAVLGSASVKCLEHPTSILECYGSSVFTDDKRQELRSAGRFGFTMALINILFASIEEELPLEQIIKGILRSPQLRDQGFRKLTLRVASIVKAAADMGII
ncbi:hypothetical protein GE061_016129 [Apolygus lucorum]|uniref:CHK kinase-like domain-containing protein n=1 Tax=Apolygus lucorum TaxID=248454 RepID=A0A6A4JXW3_APOLU|nr:hypothetical protein GE061_016129 [Apolygus lucorum]